MALNIRAEAKRYNHIISEIDAAYHEAALKLGLSDSAMMILYTAADHDGICLIGDIVGQTGICKQTINSALRRLEADGMIVLELAAGRTKRIRLTESGKVLATDTVEKIMAIENRIFGSWAREEWALYLALTERFLSAFKEEIKEL